jgi:modulator of FtsH protease
MNLNAQREQAIALPHGGAESVLATNKVIRNTYMLLSMTLLFRRSPPASLALKLPHPGMIITLIGLLRPAVPDHQAAQQRLGNALRVRHDRLHGLHAGSRSSATTWACPTADETVMMAMGGTAAIFLGLSGYALTTRKDFSFMGGFLMVGILLAFLAGLAAIFFEIPALSLTVSAAFVLLMSG